MTGACLCELNISEDFDLLTVKGDLRCFWFSDCLRQDRGWHDCVCGLLPWAAQVRHQCGFDKLCCSLLHWAAAGPQGEPHFRPLLFDRFPPEMSLWNFTLQFYCFKNLQSGCIKEINLYSLDICYVDRNKEIWLYWDISHAGDWISKIDCIALIIIETAKVLCASSAQSNVSYQSSHSQTF